MSEQNNNELENKTYQSSIKLQSVYESLQNNQQMNKIQYFGISENRSASSLYHQTPVITFPKDERFKYKNKNILTEKSKNLEIPSTLNQRSTSFGYGYKNTLDLAIQERKNFPGPDKYSTYQKLIKPQQAKTFGVSYEAYRRVYIPGVYLVGMNEDINPGVGKYEISKEFAKDKLQFSMQGRTFDQKKKEQKSPCPNTYKVKDKLQQNTRFNGITFGYGQKTQGLVPENTPGPGQYKTNVSQFDKFNKKPFHRQDIYQNNISNMLDINQKI